MARYTIQPMQGAWAVIDTKADCIVCGAETEEAARQRAAECEADNWQVTTADGATVYDGADKAEAWLYFEDCQDDRVEATLLHNGTEVEHYEPPAPR